MIRRRLFRFDRGAAPATSRGVWTMRAEVLALLAALGFVLACNGRFWQQALQGREGSAPDTWLFAAGVGVALVAMHFVLFAIAFNRWTARPLLAMLIVATAFATYFMERYGVHLNPGMIRNVMRTDVGEARELFTWALVPHLLLYAVLPLAALWRVRVASAPPVHAVLVRLAWLAAGAAVGAAALMMVFHDAAGRMRERPQLRYLITPGNYLWSLARVAYQDGRASTRPREVVGADAVRGALGAAPGVRPTLMLLVVGETARSDNWGLGGYARATTPRLAAMPEVINFAAVSSCGTDTEVSLPCMFSPWGRRAYDEARIRGAESALHVLQRAGVQVRWRDNQSGCKGVCAGLPSEALARAKVPGLCNDGRCLDEVLLEGLDAAVDASRGDQLVVLHQMGNHGPAYHLRYPSAFRRFTPACETADLRRCTREEIVNAYDNALLYTDHVLARAIEWLKSRAGSHDTALLYLSDHGESLGENGLYLHGLPYAIAPRGQTQVPMVMWLSPGFAERWRIDVACVRARAAQPVSHDHLFHTLLGMFDVATAVREPALDLAGACRQP